MTTRVVNIHKINSKRPAFDIYIGRTVRYTEFTQSSKWANPFRVIQWGKMTLPIYEVYIRALIDKVFAENLPGYNLLTPTEQNAIDKACHAIRQPKYRERGNWDLHELVNKRLGCWCKPGPCHGDILVKLIREAGIE